jgi:hypothetical protein
MCMQSCDSRGRAEIQLPSSLYNLCNASCSIIAEDHEEGMPSSREERIDVHIVCP